jgi:hypothetical protein
LSRARKRARIIFGSFVNPTKSSLVPGDLKAWTIPVELYTRSRAMLPCQTPTEALTTSIAGYGCDILIFAFRLAGLRFMSGFLRFLRCGRIVRYVPIADIQ